MLGCLINVDGIRPDPNKLRAVVDFLPPRDLKTFWSFLGLCAYLRNCIAAFAHITEPLTQLLRSDTTFVWDAAQQNAFPLLKTAIASSLILGHSLKVIIQMSERTPVAMA